MAELTTLARPYAKAAFEFARDHGALAKWSTMLSTVAAVVQAPKVAKLLDKPELSSEAKAQQLLALGGDSFDTNLGNFLNYLARNDRVSLLPQIREQFELLKSHHEKTIDVNVTTAFEMSDAQQAKLAAALKAKLQREVNLNTSVDKALIGGALVRAGDLVIDGSVRGQLAKLAEAVNI